MIDVEKYWINISNHIGMSEPGEFYEKMFEKGYSLTECFGHVYGFGARIWHLEDDSCILEMIEDDLYNFYSIPATVQQFIKLWLISNIPTNKGARDYMVGKWQHHLELGWFHHPHKCGHNCNQCEKNKITFKEELDVWKTLLKSKRGY